MLHRKTVEDWFDFPHRLTFPCRDRFCGVLIYERREHKSKSTDRLAVPADTYDHLRWTRYGKGIILPHFQSPDPTWQWATAIAFATTKEEALKLLKMG